MITENKNNYYEILEISSSANQHDILMAYRKAKEMYSSANKELLSLFSEEEIQSLSSLVDEAFGILSNQDYRQVYEQRLNTKSFSESNISYEAIKNVATNNEIGSVEKIIQRQFDMKTDRNSELSNKIFFIEDADFENEIKNCIEWSGDFLKKVREYKKISINELHQSTKVNPWYINAVESMDVQNLPVAVFVRGYVMQIAKDLGLNQKVVSDSYMKLYKSKLESKNN